MVTDCHFQENTASQGGAIFIGSGSHNLEILRSNFTMNSAFNSDGGAIYFDSSASPASPGIIDDVNFINNTGVFAGGAIFADGYNLTITDSIFFGNAADPTFGKGGAIYATSLGSLTSSLTISSTSFTDCSGFNGGAIFVGGGAVPSSETLITDCHFEGNSAEQHGGAIHNDISASSGSENLDILRSNFTMNSAIASGGAIYYLTANPPASPAIIDEVSFTNNTGEVGGAIYAEFYDLNIANSIFSGNVATNDDFVGIDIYDDTGNNVNCPIPANVAFCDATGSPTLVSTNEFTTICAGACTGQDTSCSGC